MLSIFQYDFMIRAFAAAFIIGALAPVIGIFLVVRRYSLLADTLSHVSLVGVALGMLLNFNPIIGAIAVSAFAVMGMDKLRETRKIYGESVLALFLSGSLALALILLALSGGINTNIFAYLFGSITTVTASDLWIISIFGFIVAAITFLEYKRFFMISYDEELARADGLPVHILNIALMILAAITVALGMQAVGILLVGALMVIPVLTALQFGKSFTKTLLYAIFFSILSAIIGLFASFYLNLPSGATIVITAIVWFILSLIITRNKSNSRA